MKDLYTVVEEVGGAVAMPGNTMGMGNPMPAGVNGEIGSEPMPTAKCKQEKCKKCKKKRKKYEELTRIHIR